MKTEVQSPAELTLQELCIRLGFPLHVAYTRMLSGAFGTPRKLGRVWLIPAAGVEAYVERQRATPGAP
jgi:hypothetical protein